MRELFVDASRPGFMDSGGPGCARVQALCDRVERLAPEQARGLLGSFREAAGAAWGGRDALAGRLAMVEVGPLLKRTQPICSSACNAHTFSTL